MGYYRKQFEASGLDEADWQKCFHRHQQAYIRLKLSCVRSYAAGDSPARIAADLSLSRLSVRRHIAAYLRGGLAGLCQPTRRKQPSRLTPAQQQAFKAVLLSSPPRDHGLEGCIWTGQLMKQYLHNTYRVEYRSGVYDLLERLGLSHQKAHADYARCGPRAAAGLPGPAHRHAAGGRRADGRGGLRRVLGLRAADRRLRLGREEHAPPLQDRREKRERSNGLLAVELFSGECFFQARKEAKTEQVAAYFSALAAHLRAQG